MLLGWVYHVIVCPRVARLLFCYLLADNSFPKKWLLLEGICHTKRKTESGKGSNVGGCWPDLASKWWNTGHLSKECWMRMTTVACSTLGKPKEVGTGKRWIGWQLSGQTWELNGQGSGAGWTKWDSPNPIVTFPNYSSTTRIYMDSCSWGCSLHTFVVLSRTARSSYGYREKAPLHCLSLFRALFCQLERRPSSPGSSTLQQLSTAVKTPSPLWACLCPELWVHIVSGDSTKQ
jgi:hypothetical protein